MIKLPHTWNRLGKSLTLLVVASMGCGGSSDAPDLHEVTGTVTMDGAPLPNASLQFLPKSGEGRPSWGMTDEEGNYELTYSRDAVGALPGEHIVKISTSQEAEEDPDTGETSESSPETVPDVYRTSDKLIVTVSGDGKPIDFQLNSKEGEISQPEFESELYVTPDE